MQLRSKAQHSVACVRAVAIWMSNTVQVRAGLRWRGCTRLERFVACRQGGGLAKAVASWDRRCRVEQVECQRADIAQRLESLQRDHTDLHSVMTVACQICKTPQLSGLSQVSQGLTGMAGQQQALSNNLDTLEAKSRIRELELEADCMALSSVWC